MLPITGVTWQAVVEVCQRQLELAREAMESAESNEMLWRAQGRVQACKAMLNLEQMVRALLEGKETGEWPVPTSVVRR